MFFSYSFCVSIPTVYIVYIVCIYIIYSNYYYFLFAHNKTDKKRKSNLPAFAFKTIFSTAYNMILWKLKLLSHICSLCSTWKPPPPPRRTSKTGAVTPSRIANKKIIQGSQQKIFRVKISSKFKKRY